MRGVFGLVSLVVVLAIVGLIAVRQLRTTREVATAGGASAPATGNVREQSQALQKQVGTDVAGSLQKSAEQRGDESAK